MKGLGFFVHRPVFTTMIMLALFVFGKLGLDNMGIDLYPKVDFPVITVTSVLPGADPETVERTISEPIEEELSTLSGVKNLRSISAENFAHIFIEFNLEKNVDVAFQEVQTKIIRVRSSLPSDVSEVQVQKFDLDAAPILSVVVSTPDSLEETTRFVEKQIKERLQRIKGVGNVQIIGGATRHLWIEVDPDKLQALGLTTEELASRIQTSHLELAGGILHTGTTDYTLKTKAFVESLEALNSLVIAQRGQEQITLDQVATAFLGTDDKNSISELNQKQAVSLYITRQSGENTVAVAKAVRKEIQKLQEEFAEKGVVLQVAQDLSTLIERSIEEIEFHLLFGGVLAVFIVLLFLGNLRMTLISALAIPLSVMSSFFFMHFLGFTLNTMTMLALSLSIGLLIDDAIVVVENIYRHFKTNKEAKEAALTGTSEIAAAALAITLTIVAVFLPVAFMKGIIGRFFYQFGLTIVAAVLMSLFVALTLIPMLSAHWLKEEKPKWKWFAKGMEKVETLFEKTLLIALQFKKTTLLLAFATLLTSFYFAGKIPAEFIPKQDHGEFSVSLKMPLGTPLEVTYEEMKRLQESLDGQSWLTTTHLKIGSDTHGKPNEGELYIKMKPLEERSINQFAAMELVRNLFAEKTEGVITVEKVEPVSGGKHSSAELLIELKGDDFATLETIGSELIAELQQLGGYVDLELSYQRGKPELAVQMQRETLAHTGISPYQVASTLQTYILGKEVAKFRHKGDWIPISLRLATTARQSVEQIKALSLRSQQGNYIPLNELIVLENTHGPQTIHRHNRFRVIELTGSFLAGQKVLSDAMEDVRLFLSKKELPKGYQVVMGGDAEAMQESFGHLVTALVLAILMIYMVLAAQFESFMQPLLIMLSLPFSMIGSLFLLAWTGSPMSIFTMIGIIMLMGLVTKNAILLLDYTNTLLARGLPIQEAIVQAGKIRLHPIFMTTLAMIFGMLPIALGTGSGAETRAPMALAIIGGLLSSMLLSLIVVPVANHLFLEKAWKQLHVWKRLGSLFSKKRPQSV